MPSKSTIQPVDEEAVRTRAYLMWEADGKPDGLSDHYWSLAYAEAVPDKPKRSAARAKAAPETKSAVKKPAGKKSAARKPAVEKPKKKK